MRNNALIIAGEAILPGERKVLELPSACLYTQTPINFPIHVIHGKLAGPRVFIMAAIHGDEINGVEIIRLLLKNYSLKNLIGTLIIIPVANIYGFINLSRYLPDRRDLNRSFPGSKSGSLANRLAYLLIQEVISQCTHGIDLHTGRQHIDNLPQIRAHLKTTATLTMARAFNAPVILDAKLRDGSLRQAATELNIPVLVYEGGEALRLNELAIQIGVSGILNVLKLLKMIKGKKIKKPTKVKSNISYYSGWVRSPMSGIIHPFKFLGDYVKKDETLGIIASPFATSEAEIKSPVTGLIIGKITLPLVNEGDALFHIANLKNSQKINATFTQLKQEIEDKPLVFL